MLELHCHTTYSDGTLTPTELVNAAIAQQVRALAITDHDTMGGWDEAFAAAINRLEIVPGLELSTVCNDRSLHILGFYPDRDLLFAPLNERLEGRKRRSQKNRREVSRSRLSRRVARNGRRHGSRSSSYCVGHGAGGLCWLIARGLRSLFRR